MELFHISRYVETEGGGQDRFSREMELSDSPIVCLNGFTSESGFKLGIFNMGRNRYKKALDQGKIMQARSVCPLLRYGSFRKIIKYLKKKEKEIGKLFLFNGLLSLTSNQS